MQNFLQKDIETYGVLKISEKGQRLIDGNYKESFLIAEDREYDLEQLKSSSEKVEVQAGGGLDHNLFSQLKDLRKKVAKKHGIPPYTVFMDPSLEDMTVQYPVTVEEIASQPTPF